MYGKSPDVVTNLQFERLLALSVSGKVLRPSDGKPVKEVVFVQCAGSRDENHLPYCSAVCCSASLKQAITLREMIPGSHATICYTDLRVFGRNEDFLRRAEEEKGISLVKGKVADVDIDPSTGDLTLEAEDIMTGRKKKYKANLVVLATGIVPNDPGIGIRRNREGFLLTEQESGINVVACARAPMDVSASVKDATGAALKSLQIESN
jgi:heterodisulfide reductase subunit A-like polyferredoxin